MDSIRHLLALFFKISIGIFVLVLVIWLSSSVSKSTKKSGTVATGTPVIEKSDILPSPRKYSGFFTTGKGPQANTVSVQPFEYTGTQPFSDTTNNSNKTTNTSAGTYATYDYSSYPTTLDSNGKYTVDSNTKSATTSPQTNVKVTEDASKSLYIRNLSIYQGGHIYTGISFVGEARTSLFRDGKFPIVIVDGAGKVVGVSAAVALESWSVPGWVRFETKILYTLPNKVPCTMYFEEALTQAERTRQPVRVPLPIMCN